MGAMMQFDKDFSEFVALLAAHDVRHMIVGGYALAAHGLPRATGVLDAWIWTDQQNAERLLVVLEKFGFGGGIGISESDLTADDCVLQLGYPPYRIDLLTRIDGVEFDDAWGRHIELVLGGVNVPFIGRDDLITNKRAVGRPQDVVDVKRLTEFPT